MQKIEKRNRLSAVWLFMLPNVVLRHIHQLALRRGSGLVIHHLVPDM